MPRILRRAITLCCAVIVAAATTTAQSAKPRQKFTRKQIARGADLFARNCSPCHGAHMDDPNGAFDLRTFPPDQHDRFINSVTNGKNSMPPWGGLLKPEDIEALWSYVVAGEKHSNTKSAKP